MTPLETRVLLALCSLVERLLSGVIGFAARHSVPAGTRWPLADAQISLLWVMRSLQEDRAAMRAQRARGEP